MLPFDTILLHVQAIITLSNEEIALFQSLVTVEELKKKEFFIEEGKTCKYSAFVTKGCLKSSSINENGVEHVLQFAPQNWWMTDMYSFLLQKPSSLNIEAIEDATFIQISKTNQDILYNKIPKFERYFRILIEKNLIASRQRVLDILELSARERFEKFCTTYPNLILQVSQKSIASYIGVTPEFFSKLRTEYLKNS